MTTIRVGVFQQENSFLFEGRGLFFEIFGQPDFLQPISYFEQLFMLFLSFIYAKNETDFLLIG